MINSDLEAGSSGPETFSKVRSIGERLQDGGKGMLKKLTLLTAAACAIAAFVVPAVAQAEVLRTAEGEHALLEEGMQVDARSTNFVFHTGWGELQCEEVVYHGELVDNQGRVELEPTTPATATRCSREVSLNLGVLNLDLPPNWTGLVGSWPEFGFTWANNCTSNDRVAFYYSYGSGDLVLHESWHSQIPSSTCGQIKFAGTFSLKLADGTPVEVAAE